MKIKRAASLVSMMPNKLMIVTLSKEEALSLWYFMDAETRLPITKQMLRHHLAEECGVFAQQLNAVMRSSTIAETLVMESSESKSTNITVAGLGYYHSVILWIVKRRNLFGDGH